MRKRPTTHSLLSILALCLAALSCQAQDFERERATVPFEVSKVSPLPPYTKAKFNEIWKGFREQYSIREGIFVKWDWSQEWLEWGGTKPELRKATFEVISGLDASGKPLSGEITVRLVTLFESKTRNLDRDVRGKRSSSKTTTAATRTMVLADASLPKAPKFSCTFEVDEEEEDRPATSSGYVPKKKVYYEVGVQADTALNQTRFIEALKAGSEFRVILPKEISCQACGGIGRPAGSKSMVAKCGECSGSGKLQTIEVFLVKW